MIRIAFPDPLVWQAGIEYGLQGVAEALRGKEFKCILNSEGPLLEAVAFAVWEMRIADVEYTDGRRLIKEDADIFLLPRVRAMEIESVQCLVRRSKTVITSDPQMTRYVRDVVLFTRRDVIGISAILKSCLGEA